MFKWNNIEFRDKGIIVEHTPKIAKPKKRINVYTIEGRNGFLSIDTGTYDSFILSVSCHYNSNNVNFEDIKEFLDGYGTITMDGQKEYTAIIQNQIDFEKVQNFKSFLVQFLVNPIAHDINSTTYNVTATPSTLNISNATYEMDPIIEITGTGNIDVTINDNTINIIFKYVVIETIPTNNINVITEPIKAQPIKISPINFFLFCIFSFFNSSIINFSINKSFDSSLI